jgi:hypothetical protein
MLIPKNAKVNGAVVQTVNGNPCYRVRLVDGPAGAMESLTTSTELWANGEKYVLMEDGNFHHLAKPPIVE